MYITVVEDDDDDSNSSDKGTYPSLSYFSSHSAHCLGDTGPGAKNSQQRRLRLYDQTAAQSLAVSGLPQLDRTTKESKRFIAIITAPVLLNCGRQVDYGFFCRGCRDGTDVNAMHSRIKYTMEEMPGHVV